MYGGLCNQLPGCTVGYVTSYLEVRWVMYLVAWMYGGLCNQLPGCTVGYVTSYLGVRWVM